MLDLELTANSIAFDGKVVSLETGRLLFEYKNARLTLQSNMMVCRAKEELICGTNPGSRELRIGDPVFMKTMHQFH